MNFTSPPAMSLSDVIRGLRVGVAAWGGLGWLRGALVLLVYARLGQIMGRMERLLARFRAGRLRPLGARTGTRVEGVRREMGERLWPRQFGWLVRAGSWHAAGFGGQLRLVLQQPEMVALLIAAPQAARILRPLCRMSAVESSLLRPGVVSDCESVPEVAAVKVKRVRKPRPKVDWGRIPIPRGVLSAVRRGRVLKG